MKREELDQIAKNIQKYMRVFDLTQLELAEKIGCSNSAISLWLRGENIPRIEKIDKMCEVFGCTRSDILVNDKTDEEIIKDKDFSIMVKLAEELNREGILKVQNYIKDLNESYKGKSN